VVAGAQRVKVIMAPSSTRAGELLPLRGGPRLAALRVLKSGDAVVLGIEREGGLLFLPFELD